MTVDFLCFEDPNWTTVTFPNLDQKHKTYDLEKSTGDLYWNETKVSLVIKSALIFVVTPLYTMGVITWHVGRAFISDTKSHLYEVIKAPLFALAVMGTVACAPLAPYRVRKWEAQIEHKWQNQVSYRDDFRQKEDPTLNCWDNFKYGIEHSQAFYLAWCFQKRGNISDPR